MPARARKFIGLIVMLAWLAFYALLMAGVSRWVPGHWAAQFAYYAVIGTAWCLPMLPLIAWMQREK